MKTVEVQYYAVLREQRGLAREQHQTAAETVGGLYRELRALFGFALDLHQLRMAVNDDFVDEGTPLSTGDRVVFLPPVAGG